MSNEQLLKFYVEASAGFGQIIDALEEPNWSEVVEIEQLSVRDLVSRVVLADAQFRAVLEHETSTSDLKVSADVLGDSPIATWRGTALAAISALEKTTKTDFVLDSKEVPLTRLAGYRISENVVAGYDISKTVGLGYEIDKELAQWLLDFWLPVAGQLIDSDSHPNPLTPNSDSAKDRLLALLGRK